mmetsp:Transcript_49069/g.81467  ORF Transcript_49069/g.81467 Transcript_49069/m.81467 type:complete len:330 (+) Transcript_49069:361-1350(+)|eukprot:CAMPEP_0119331382 /NCGR_PEP_ID=MMETSP1333-20130426/80481_1 /TAXON_ID=418940 /ORGANISM="Scyphosphaera apsteinii, Strain RCC1455" /LENGTH=329 /DNA_ID=CAMNT_0007340975 /DNA_START=235 /DNA_END=1224 /DNA_ORIENTATION=-
MFAIIELSHSSFVSECNSQDPGNCSSTSAVHVRGALHQKRAQGQELITNINFSHAVHILRAQQTYQGPRPPMCHGYDEVEGLARAMSAHIMAAVKQYRTHGYDSIFAQGPEGKTYDYAQIKTRFMWYQLCQISHERRVTSMCEIGFNAGLSAILLLQAVPRASVVSFDLGSQPWTRYAAGSVSKAYESRLTVKFGPTSKSLLEMRKQHPNFDCDIMVVDGDKKELGRYADLHRLRALSYKGAKLFINSVTSLDCINGTYKSSHSREYKAQCQNYSNAGRPMGGYPVLVNAPSSAAYNMAVREGLLRILACAWPPLLANTDGICMADFIS